MGGDNGACLRGEYLRQVARNLRQLGGNKLKECPGTIVSLYYDANITVEGMDPEYEECSDDDMVYVCVELEKIVKELENKYPRYTNEFLETKLCPVPEVEVTRIEDDEDDGDTIDQSPGAVTDPPAPTDSPIDSPTSSPTKSLTQSSNADADYDGEGVELTVVTNKQELPPWLAGPANRLLEK